MYAARHHCISKSITETISRTTLSRVGFFTDFARNTSHHNILTIVVLVVVMMFQHLLVLLKIPTCQDPDADADADADAAAAAAAAAAADDDEYNTDCEDDNDVSLESGKDDVWLHSWNPSMMILLVSDSIHHWNLHNSYLIILLMKDI